MGNREKLQNTIAYALENGTFSKKRMAQEADLVCAYGTGKFFHDAYEQWDFRGQFNVAVCCDRDETKWGKYYYGLCCVPFDEIILASHQKKVVVIPFLGEPDGVIEQCREHGIPYARIDDCFFEILCQQPTKTEWFKSNAMLDVYDVLNDEKSKEIYTEIICNRIAEPFITKTFKELMSEGEYFSTDVFKIGEDETYVDGGAYNGDTIERFLQIAGNCHAIYGFEMASENYKELNKRVRGICDRVHLFNVGLWDTEGELMYGKEDTGSMESYGVFKSKNKSVTKSVRLDDVIDETVTLIKMDIEGAELNALRGAEEIIKRDKPKLAICVYHRLQDLWMIPLYVKSLVPEYKLFIRHHQADIGGTVMYAIAD